MERVFWATMPFFIALLIGIVALVFLPPIITFLPGILIG
jgi:TRAP-type C4-dicarboxylate transport system permease large subunit